MPTMTKHCFGVEDETGNRTNKNLQPHGAYILVGKGKYNTK